MKRSISCIAYNLCSTASYSSFVDYLRQTDFKSSVTIIVKKGQEPKESKFSFNKIREDRAQWVWPAFVQFSKLSRKYNPVEFDSFSVDVFHEEKCTGLSPDMNFLYIYYSSRITSLDCNIELYATRSQVNQIFVLHNYSQGWTSSRTNSNYVL